jgi:hypothetical protein
MYATKSFKCTPLGKALGFACLVFVSARSLSRTTRKAANGSSLSMVGLPLDMA